MDYIDLYVLTKKGIIKMKFRRNLKDEKVFKSAAIFFLIIVVVLTLIYIFTQEKVLIRFILGLLLVSPLYFYISFLLKNSYVEINKDKIVLINHKSNNIEIIVSEIQSILIPSEKAVKSKVKGNPIIIKHKDKQNIISYSVEIEEYIKNNLNVNIEYYDKYSKAIK